jgi:hypothetical protein
MNQQITSVLNGISYPVAGDKAHLDHPEDLIFHRGHQGALLAIKSLVDSTTDSGSITLKYDGYPSLVFGCNDNGKFSIMDKHMFNRKDLTGRQIFSPQDFVQYDANRGVDREDLYQIIDNIWDGLASICNGVKGYIWGDLMFGNVLTPINGEYVFKANPSGLTYRVVENSPIGKLLKGKVGGLAVHQKLDVYATNTSQAVSLDGTIGPLKNTSNVAIIGCNLPSDLQLSLDDTSLNNVFMKIQKDSKIIDSFLSSSPIAQKSFSQIFMVFVNRKIVSGNVSNMLNGLQEFISSRKYSPSTIQAIIQYLNDNVNALTSLFTIWTMVYNLKMSLVEQINSAMMNAPIKAYLDDGTMAHEGYVSNGIKLVDRMGFSRQNLASNA